MRTNPKRKKEKKVKYMCKGKDNTNQPHVGNAYSKALNSLEDANENVIIMKLT